MKFGKLILRKISKIFVTPPEPLAAMRGPTSKGKEGEKGRERKRLREGREGKGKVGRGRERGVASPNLFWPCTLDRSFGEMVSTCNCKDLFPCISSRLE